MAQETKQDRKKDRNDYEILGLKRGASWVQIQAAKKAMALLWAPDHYNPSKTYPPDNKPKELSEVNEEYRIILKAYKNLYHKFKSVSPEAKKNIEKLIKSKRLSDQDFQTMEDAGNDFMWIIYRNRELADYVVNHIRHYEKDRPVMTFIQLKDNYLGDLRHLPWKEEFYDYLKESWAKLLPENSTEQLTEHDESFLLYILERAGDFGRFDSDVIKVRLNSNPFLVATKPFLSGFSFSEKVKFYSKDSPVLQYGAKWIMDFVRDYLSGRKAMSLNRFRQQLIFASHVFFNLDVFEKTYNFEEDLNNKTIVFIHDKLRREAEEFNEKGDAESLEKAKQKNKKCQLIEETVIQETLLWIKGNEKDPEGWQKQMMKDIPQKALFEKVKLIEASDDLTEIEKSIAQAKLALNEQPPVQKPTAELGALNSIYQYYLHHPKKATAKSLALLTVLTTGAIALDKYLQNENVYNWLRQDVGMHTPADVSIIMAGIILILFTAAVLYARKAANQSQPIAPVIPEAKPSEPQFG